MRQLRPRPSPPREDAPVEGPLRLHLNENPYGCSLLVQESLSISESFALRPGPLSRTFSGALSRYVRRPVSEIYVADSLDALLLEVLRAVCTEERLVYAYAPFSQEFARAALRAGIGIVPLRTVREREALALLRASVGAPLRPVYLGSPADPTGEVVPPLEVVALLKAGFTVIGDESYAEFTDKTLGVLGREFPNLISLRSFAPWAGLWGIPVSYALTDPAFVAALDASWPQTRLLAPSRIAAGASLDDAFLLQNRVKHIRLERSRLYRRLRKLNFVQPRYSHAPFICCEVTRGDPARVVALLEREGILVHPCAENGLPGHIRISVGTSDHTDRLVAAMIRISVEL